MLKTGKCILAIIIATHFFFASACVCMADSRQKAENLRQCLSNMGFSLKSAGKSKIFKLPEEIYQRLEGCEINVQMIQADPFVCVTLIMPYEEKARFADVFEKICEALEIKGEGGALGENILESIQASPQRLCLKNLFLEAEYQRPWVRVSMKL